MEVIDTYCEAVVRNHKISSQKKISDLSLFSKKKEQEHKNCECNSRHQSSRRFTFPGDCVGCES
jgi:hypothetical protein